MDITNDMQTFREASRHIWNTCFRQDAKLDQNWKLFDAFSEVYVALFNAIVRFNLPESAPPIPHLYAEKKVLEQYRVTSIADWLHLMINRDKPAAGYWDHPTEVVTTSGLELRLISLFDWDSLGFREFRYFRVRILKADDHDLIGRDALADTSSCKIEYVENE